MAVSLLAAAVLAFAGVQPVPKNTVSVCGISLVAPARWKASTLSNRTGECEIRLTPPGWLRLRRLLMEERDVPSWAIRLRTTIGGLDAACSEYFLCREGEVWTLLGRATPRPVEEFTARGCRVFHGIREQAAYDRSGYRGLGEFPTAIVITKKRVAEIEVDDSFVSESEEVFDTIVKSVSCR